MRRQSWMRGAPLLLVVLILFVLGRGMLLHRHASFEKKTGELPMAAIPLLEHPTQFFHLEDLKGEVFLLHFWATWCGVCLQEHPVLMEMKKEGVTLVGVAYRDNPKEAQHTLAKKGNPFKINLLDATGQFGIDFGVSATPETFLLDENGRVHYRFKGPLDFAAYSTTIKPEIEKLKDAKKEA